MMNLFCFFTHSCSRGAYFLKSVVVIITGGLVFSSCDYLDIVPDNVATIDNAFSLRSTAERHLYTCYSWMPDHADLRANPAFLGSDEFWVREQFNDFDAPAINIVRGDQNIVNPNNNYWDGRNQAKNLFEGIRDCNIFLENIGGVPDMTEQERNRWIAEVKFLKAYYHFWLLRMYGPIPLMRENIPVSSSVEEVQIPRDPVDESFDYIISLIDEALPDLPETIENEVTELGRISRPIALAVKAKILVTAASPLFNGNKDYTGFTNRDGTPLFNTNYDAEKWEEAVHACELAVDAAHTAGHELYRFNPNIIVNELSPETETKMDLRNAVTEKWNSEVIWGNPNSRADGGSSHSIQRQAMIRGLEPEWIEVTSTRGNLAPPLHIAEMFYSENGVPLREDITWNYNERFSLQIAGEEDRFYIKEGYTTAKLNFDREPRFYAYLGFDGGIWYGHGRFDDENTHHVEAKVGQSAGMYSPNTFSRTGYWTKKLVHYENIVEQPNNYTIEEYPWPVLRLADLYLLYAEALNELNGAGSEALTWVNEIRERAGLETVQESWSNYSNQPNKYKSKEGLREIIQRERLNELAFEGQRFWDLRRWKEAEGVLNNTIRGWDTSQENAEAYYRPLTLYNLNFNTRDYLWPLREQSLSVNENLVQNPGW